MLRAARGRGIPRILALLIVLGPAEVLAQSTASISGVVKDTAGAVMPGVSVTVKNDASGAAQDVLTDGEGRYQVSALPAGTYTVTATLTGFKTAEVKTVRLAIGQPLSIPLALEIGSLEETVNVLSSSELINTETATVAATLNADQLTRMPTPTRNALNAVAFLPGVNTTGTNRDSTINGLPEGFLSITLDGVSNNDNFLRNTDGFFASVTPRQDAVEAVTVTLAAAGAQVGGGAGAVTMAFQTRSGGNRFTGSAYEYYRNPSFNSNYYFNEVNHQGKNEVKLNTFGGRVGGPIVIPGLYNGRGKAFYFGHYEQVRFPNSFTRTRTVFNPRVADGWFRYQFGTEVREVNLLQLAAANGQISAKDPIMLNLMGLIDAATKTTGTRSANADPLYDSYVWQSPATLFEHQPTFRLDYNLTDNHRLNGSWTQITAKRTPDYLNNADPRFPGAPNQRDFVSTRPLLSMALRSVLSKNIVSELRGGLTAYAAGSNFGYPSDVASRNDPTTFADGGGFAITTPGDTTDWHTSNGPTWRGAPTYSIDETLTWQRNAHTMTFGGNLLISNAEASSQQIVPGITIGFNTDFDPANGLFNTTNFPGASSAQLTAARNTYAVLTGRVASVNSQAVLDESGKYVELAPSTLPGGMRVYGMFAQDSWRVRPNLTLTGGIRYDVLTPFKPSSNVMSAVTMDEHLRPVGRRQRRHLQPVQLPPAGRVRRQHVAVHPARGRFGGLQDGPEQLRAVRQHRLAARRGVRLPAHAARRSEPGDAPGRILRGLRASGPDAVHRSLRREPRRLDLPEPRCQHRPRAGRSDVAGAALANGSPLLGDVQPGSQLSDRDPVEPGRQPQRVRPGHRDRAGPQLDGRLRALDRQGHGGRDPLRRQPRRQRVGIDQLQLRREQRQRLHVHPWRESRRQRLHGRVQAGDAEPPGQ